MPDTLNNFIDEQETPILLEFIFSIPAPESSILLRNDILLAFETWAEHRDKAHSLPGSWRFLRKVQEILCLAEERILVYRHRRPAAVFTRCKKRARSCCP